jgi:hypothetical protein
MRTVRATLVSLVLLLLLNVGSKVSAQSVVEVIGQKEAIPAGYKTYSLFLICNPDWLAPAKSSGLSDLYTKFQAFGRSIGDDQAAVWFWKTTVKPGWEMTMPPSDAIDVERSIRFCKAWKLKPSDGPYLVITTTRPDESHLSSGVPDGTGVFALGDLSATQISSLLDKLTDSLLLTGKVDSSMASVGVPDPNAHSTAAGASPPASGTAAPAAASGALWIRILSATQELIGEFGCAVSLKVNAGPLQADLKSCKSSS